PSTSFLELRGDESAIGINIHASIDMVSSEPLFEIEAFVDSKEEDFLSLVTEPYDPVAHRWLRIRDEGGALYFEHSADGVTWEELAVRSPNQIPVDDLLVSLGVRTNGSASDAP